MNRAVFLVESSDKEEAQNCISAMLSWRNLLLASTHAYWDMSNQKSEVHYFSTSSNNKRNHFVTLLTT